MPISITAMTLATWCSKPSRGWRMNFRLPTFCRVWRRGVLVPAPRASAQTCFSLSDSFRLAVEALNIELPNATRITISTGTATYREGDAGIDALLKRADTALYAAKADGRNCVVPSD